ncbi:MAG TPA: DUF2757 domain-containing protein [Firmicutes bacterium]|nr:DUF2757 domain-containing protein [Bacillota bacterium]
MLIRYVCEYCTSPIGELRMDVVDEERLGLHCLTEEERRDIIKVDEKTNTMVVTSLCDKCIQILGLDEGNICTKGTNFLN